MATTTIERESNLNAAAASGVATKEKKRKSKKAAAPSVDGMFDVKGQIGNVVLRETKRAGKGIHGLVFSTYMKKGFAGGGCPTLKIIDATLGSVGKAADQRRGLDLIEFRLDNNTKGHMVKLALGINRADNPGLIELCKSVWDTFVQQHDPVRMSTWYQSKFPQLDDGTKVHFATGPMQSPIEMRVLEIEDSTISWDSPARTWGEAFYGEDDESRWYPKLKVMDQYSIYCYKADGKPYSKVAENGMPVYNSDGVSLSNVNLLKSFLGSNLYTRRQWRCDSMIQLTAMEVRCGVRERFPESGNPRYGIHPVFHLRTVGPIILVEHDETSDTNGLSAEQRENAIIAHLFEGRQMPSRKRRTRDEQAEGSALDKLTGNGKSKKTKTQAASSSDAEDDAGGEGDDDDDGDGDGDTVALNDSEDD